LIPEKCLESLINDIFTNRSVLHYSSFPTLILKIKQLLLTAATPNYRVVGLQRVGAFNQSWLYLERNVAFNFRLLGLAAER
jgi:hypothetical protein